MLLTTEPIEERHYQFLQENHRTEDSYLEKGLCSYTEIGSALKVTKGSQ